MKKLLRLSALLLPVFFAGVAYAAEIPGTITLWPGAAPGSEKVTITEKITERSKDPQLHDRIYTQIVTPSLEVHRPDKPNGIAVVVAPGGGYLRIVIDKEGPDTSAWLNRLGITAFVLKYRLPAEGHEHGADAPLADAQRAIRLIRTHAKEWGLDPQRIGFCGYSAGGHLATSIAFFSDAPTHPAIDDVDQVSARPDFAIIGYAVGARGKEPASIDALPPGQQILWKYHVTAKKDANWPPAFIIHAYDDPTVPSETSAQLYEALKASGAKAEMHIFARGGHGFGIRDAKGPLARWPDLCEDWMKEIGVLR